MYVYVFNATSDGIMKDSFPCVVFSSQKKARKWIKKKYAEGILTQYLTGIPLNPKILPVHWHFEKGVE